MTDTADEAVLRTKYEGETHVVRWDAQTPDGYVARETCENPGYTPGAGAGGGVWRTGTASGEFLGRRFKPGEYPSLFADLARGVFATTCSYRSVDFDEATGEIEATFHL